MLPLCLQPVWNSGAREIPCWNTSPFKSCQAIQERAYETSAGHSASELLGAIFQERTSHSYHESNFAAARFGVMLAMMWSLSISYNLGSGRKWRKRARLCETWLLQAPASKQSGLTAVGRHGLLLRNGRQLLQSTPDGRALMLADGGDYMARFQDQSPAISSA